MKFPQYFSKISVSNWAGLMVPPCDECNIVKVRNELRV